jgi:hypothetical protein
MQSREIEQGSAVGAQTETGPAMKKKATQVLWWCFGCLGEEKKSSWTKQ